MMLHSVSFWGFEFRVVDCAGFLVWVVGCLLGFQAFFLCFRLVGWFVFLVGWWRFAVGGAFAADFDCVGLV